MLVSKRKSYFIKYSLVKLFERFSIALLFGFIPIPVFYVRLSEKDNITGIVRFIFVMINRKFKDDLSILIHELTHISQIFKTLGFHYIMYNMIESYTLDSEIEAYSNQCAYMVYHHNKNERHIYKKMICLSVATLLVNPFNYVLTAPNKKEIYIRLLSEVNRKLRYLEKNKIP